MREVIELHDRFLPPIRYLIIIYGIFIDLDNP